MKSLREQLLEFWVLRWWGSLVAAIAFYTCLPVPSQWALAFENVARFAPTVGLFIGGLLYVEDAGLQHLGMPTLTRSAIVVVSWIALTGGLHLDGAMDTADGLAVQNPTRRLQVMVDSATGAFGAIAAVALVLLKTTALADIQDHRGWILMAAAGWGRWGQVVAIALYPYLKPQGKGAFHKKAIRMPQDVLMGWLLIVLLLGGLPLFFNPGLFPMVMGMSTSGCAIALLVGAWFYWQLNGHTGDTYGAVVEWTEALLLCLFTFY